jgi:drug/metabolite transporter (DMT)-like permease
MSPRALFYLTAANFLGGASYLGSAYALRGYSATAVVFWRTLLGMIVFIPFLIRALKRRYSKGQWTRMAAVALFGYAAPLILGTIGQDWSSATNASLLVGIEPVSITLLSALFLGERLMPLRAAAIAGGIAGASLIVLQGIPFWSASIQPQVRGDLLLILHGFCWSLYSVIGKPVLKDVDAMSFTAITTALGLVPIAAAAYPSVVGAPIIPSYPAFLGVVFLGLGGTFLGTLSWNKALELVPASQLANFIFLQPLIGVLLGVFIENDRFTAWSALGGGLILAGVYLTSIPAPSALGLLPRGVDSRPEPG